jgi:hypothetical protein
MRPLAGECPVSPKTKIESVITDDAVAMLGEKLSTPLQFEFI